MKTLTQDDYTFLEKNNTPLTTAFESHYVRLPDRSVLLEFVRIYKELGYTAPTNINCSSCVVRLCRTLFIHKRDYENKQQQIKEEENEKSIQQQQNKRKRKKTSN